MRSIVTYCLMFAVILLCGCSKQVCVADKDAEHILLAARDVETKGEITGDMDVDDMIAIYASAYHNSTEAGMSGNYFWSVSFYRDVYIDEYPERTWWYAAQYWPMEGTLDMLCYAETCEDETNIVGHSYASKVTDRVSLNVGDIGSGSIELVHGRKAECERGYVIEMPFHHAYSWITVKARCNKTVSDDNQGVYINYIRLNDYYHSGTIDITFDSDGDDGYCTTRNPSNKYECDWYYNSYIGKSYEEIGEVRVLEQPATSMLISYSVYSYGKTTNHTVTKTLSGNWNEETHCVYELNFSLEDASGKLVLDTTILPWTTNDKNVAFD